MDGANISGETEFNNCRFTFANLRWVNFYQAKLNNCRFFKSNLSFAILSKCHIESSTFKKATLDACEINSPVGDKHKKNDVSGASMIGCSIFTEKSDLTDILSLFVTRENENNKDIGPVDMRGVQTNLNYFEGQSRIQRFHKYIGLPTSDVLQKELLNINIKYIVGQYTAKEHDGIYGKVDKYIVNNNFGEDLNPPNKIITKNKA